jgi:transposase
MNPFSRSVYVFSNRRRTRVKILGWDCNGFWSLMKRLEQDRFIWPDEAVVPTLTGAWLDDPHRVCARTPCQPPPLALESAVPRGSRIHPSRSRVIIKFAVEKPPVSTVRFC